MTKPAKRREYFLPWPPTVNSLWRNLGRTVLSKRGRLWKQAAQMELLSQERPREPFQGPVWVTIELRPPDRRRRDLDNHAKAVLDALVDAGILIDDSMHVVRRLVIESGPVEKRGAVRVNVQW